MKYFPWTKSISEASFISTTAFSPVCRPPTSKQRRKVRKYLGVASEKYKASNCSSRLLNFCLLCSNLRQFYPLIGSTFTHSLTLKISDHRFTIKWKSALEQIVKFFWNLLSRKLLYFSFLCTCCLDVSLFKWRFSYWTMKRALRTLK